MVAAALPAPPSASFASDNAAGVSADVMAALVEANRGPALAYGNEPWTAAATTALQERFDAPVDVQLCWGGTGANIVALATLVHPWQSILTVDSAHIVVDEAGGPARFTGSTITTVPHQGGKLVPDALEPYVGWLGNEHRAQPRVVSVSQATEMGTVYTVDELGALADRCHAHDLLLHVDGARIANALVATGSTLAEMIRDTGVDVLSFGMTKNGAMYGDAVVHLRPELAAHARFVRKQAAQLVSKSRFVAAQLTALLHDDLWLRNAAHANAMAQRLAAQVAAIPDVDVTSPPEVNSVFARIPWDRLDDLMGWSFFWPWEPANHTVRWMTSFATTAADVDAFATGIRKILAS
jgi:threonine aldolase